MNEFVHAEGPTTNQRLETERNLWLATVRPDGRPHVAPVWFVWKRSRFWIGTGLDAVKTRNILADPRVSVTLEDGDLPVVAEGTAIVHREERPDDVVQRFNTKYQWDVTTTSDIDVGTIVLLEIDPTRWLFNTPEAPK